MLAKERFTTTERTLDKSKCIPIHFDVKDHYIDLETFIKTANAIEKIANGISDIIFDQKPQIKILILPSEEGSFLEIIGFAMAGLWAFSQSDFGKEFIKETTGKYPSEWGKESGIVVKKSINFILCKNNDELIKSGITKEKMPIAFVGRSDFYRACQENTEIKAIGFSEDANFPIKNYDFRNYITADYLQELPVEQKLHKLAIVAPVIKQRKKSKIKWQAEDALSKKLFKFKMEDEDFREKFFNGKYPLKESGEDDVIIGLFQYNKVKLNDEIKLIGSVAAKKIYKFNDEIIEEIPEDLKIESVDIIEKIKNYKKENKEAETTSENQMNLFENN